MWFIYIWGFSEHVILRLGRVMDKVHKCVTWRNRMSWEVYTSATLSAILFSCRSLKFLVAAVSFIASGWCACLALSTFQAKTSSCWVKLDWIFFHVFISQAFLIISKSLFWLTILLAFSRVSSALRWSFSCRALSNRPTTRLSLISWLLISLYSQYSDKL